MFGFLSCGSRAWRIQRERLLSGVSNTSAGAAPRWCARLFLCGAVLCCGADDCFALGSLTRFLFGLAYASRFGCGRDKRTPLGDGPPIQTTDGIKRISAAHDEGRAVRALRRLICKCPRTEGIIVCFLNVFRSLSAAKVTLLSGHQRPRVKWGDARCIRSIWNS